MSPRSCAPGPPLAIEDAAPASPDARALVDRLDADLQQRYPGAPTHGLTDADLRDPRLVFLIARLNGRPVGCGALRGIGPDMSEIKRMFVDASSRGLGIGRHLLEALEARARARGDAVVRIETGNRQPEAIALYRSAGYRDIPPFGEYVSSPVTVCLEKVLAAP